MRRDRRWTTFVGLALLAAGAGAAEPPVSQHGIFVDTVDVTLVNVEVVVTRDGEPVTDLGKEDFEVFDDGEAVAVTHFSRVDGGRRSEAPASAVSAPAAVPPAAAPIVEPSIVVVLVDNAFVAPASREHVFKTLRAELDRLFGANAQVMVVSKDREVEVVAPLTTDRRAVEAALDRLEKTAPTSALTAMTVRRLVNEISRGAAPPANSLGADLAVAEMEARRSLGDVRNLAEETYGEVRRSAGLLRGFLGSLAGLEGRKALLYVADDLPLYPGELLFRIWFERYGTAYGVSLGLPSVETALRELSTASEIRALAADAAANRVTFYPIGVRQSVAQQRMSAENQGLSGTPASGALGAMEPTSQGLELLALDTGGAAAIGGLDPSWLVDRLRSDLASYYSLGFPARHGGDGEAHRLDVKVKRPGLEVRHLESYRAKSAEQQMRDRTLAALYHDRLENPLGVRLAVGADEPAEKDHYRLPLALRIPLASLVLLPQEEARVGRVSLTFVVRDDRGRLSEPTRVEVPIRAGLAASPEVDVESAVYTTELLLRRGANTIAIGVRDELGNVGSTISRRVQVGGGKPAPRRGSSGPG